MMFPSDSVISRHQVERGHEVKVLGNDSTMCDSTNTFISRLGMLVTT